MNKRNKVLWTTIFTSCLVLCAMALFTPMAQAQSDPLPPTTMSDVPPTAGKIVDTTLAALKASQSNVWWVAYAMRAPSLEKKWGGGIGVFWPIVQMDSTNVQLRTLAGTRVDYVNGGFWMPSGNLTIDVPIKPLAWTGIGFFQTFTVTPIAYAGIGVPLSGAKVGNFTVPGSIRNNNGDPTAITGFGLAVRLFSYKSATFEAAYDREKWSGFDGMQDRFGIALNIKR